MSGYRLTVVTDAREQGGAERQLALLVTFLPDDVEVSVLAADPSVAALVGGGRPRARQVALPAGLPAALRALRSTRPDVVLVNLPAFPSCRDAVLAALALRLPLVLVDHLPTPGLSWRGRALQRLATRGAAARISVGERSARDVERLAGLPPGSVRTVPNGVLVPPDVPVRTPGARTRAVFVGRLEPQKGVDVLLRALERVPDVDLVVVGDGSQRALLEAAARDRGLGGRVTWTGTADPEPHYRAADLLVLPSRAEAMPLTVLEAMVRGLPVVATRVGSVAEVVEDGRTGLLVPPDDVAALAAALLRMAGDADLRARCGRAGRERGLREHDAQVMAQRYDALLRAAAGARTSSST